MARYSRIHLGPARKNDPQVLELPAAAAIAPGSMLAIAAGEFDAAGASHTGRIWIAQENYLAQKGVEAPYAEDDRVIGLEPEPGTMYAGIIATGTNVTAIGTPLALAAGGKLAVAAADGYVVAFADEAFNNNTGSDQLIRIRVAGTPGPVGPQGEAG